MKKGDLTKAQILSMAKKEFYEKGYTSTKMNSITKALNIQPSWITYHFKTKDNLTAEIYRELFDKISERIHESVLHISDTLQFHFVRIRLMYRILFRDDNTRRFFYELNKKKVNYLATKDTVDNMYREIINAYHITVTESEFQMIRGIDIAGRMDFFTLYMEGKRDIPFDDAVTILEGVVPRLLGIEQTKIDSMLLSSIKIANSISVDDISLLN